MVSVTTVSVLLTVLVLRGECRSHGGVTLDHHEVEPSHHHHHHKHHEKEAPPLVCDGKHEVYMVTEYEDNTCDANGEWLGKWKGACRCDYGYVRDKDWYCIEESKCPSKCTKHHEVWTLSWYEDDTCDAYGAKLKTPVNACRCEEDYVRDSSGNCIYYENCPSKCTKLYEEWIYADYTDETCDTPSILLDAPTYACRCEYGLVRDADGECIDPSYCPSKCKKKGEVWVETWYGDKTCDAPGSKLNASIYACRCDYGLVRDSNGECIDPKHCPPKCKKLGEVWVETSYGDKTCNAPGTELDAPILACRCDYGLVRDAKGECIDPSFCPPKCTKHGEIWAHTWYGDKTCDAPGIKLEKSVDACRCDIGLVRNAAGECIDPEKCPYKCTKQGEVWAHTRYGDKTCDAPGIKLEKSIDACRCDVGLVRNAAGECIDPEKCPSKCSKVNEVWAFTSYGDKTCDAPGIELEQPIEACRCDVGFVRGADGECIDPEKCPPKCTKANEEWAFTLFGDKTCDAPGIELKQPIHACRCHIGYVRNASGECINPGECPPKCTKANEEWAFTLYGDKTCDAPGIELKQPIHACRCHIGYVRNASGECIEPHLCPSKCQKANEVFVHTDYEDSTCDNPGAKMASFVDACRCNIGFVRDVNNDCILELKCPPKCIKANEIWINAINEDATCDGPGAAMITSANACRCDVGFVRDANGNCIEQSQCPPKSVKAKEELSGTVPTLATTQTEPQMGLFSTNATLAVPPRSARDTELSPSQEKSILPPELPKCTKANEVWVLTRFEDKTCSGPGKRMDAPQRACRCNLGYVRNADGDCIEVRTCPPKCPKANERFVLAFNEDSTCNEQGKAMPTSEWSCRCVFDHVRNDQGNCILKTDCPPKCKNANEEYILATHEDSTCDAPGLPLSVPIFACRCQFDYVRNAQGECILGDNCPPMCSGINEIWTYARYLDSTCNTSGAEMKIPTMGCRCRKETVRNGNGVCISTSSCPDKCYGINEIFVYASYEDSTCDVDGVEMNIPMFGCRCEDGFVRNANGVCIPGLSCPGKCTKAFEMYVYSDYEDATCEGPGSRLPTLTRACRCFSPSNSDYVRNAVGDCIPISECPKCQKPNEVYISSQYTDGTCANPAGEFQQTPVYGCRCNKGYVRDTSGDCIEQYKCFVIPKATCSKPNETMVTTQSEDSTCSGTGAPLSSTTSACRCISGHVRNSTGDCIPQSECPSVSSDTPNPVVKCAKLFEIYINASTEDNTCTGPGAKMASPGFACRCFRMLVRDANGNCVPKSKCPA